MIRKSSGTTRQISVRSRNSSRPMKTEDSLIPKERIEKIIFLIRGQKVLLDRDLAALYGVETRVLNQAVRRNRDRFPADFMFELTREEILRISQFVISSGIKFSRKVSAYTGEAADSTRTAC
jgi:hypothetical protein